MRLVKKMKRAAAVMIAASIITTMSGMTVFAAEGNDSAGTQNDTVVENNTSGGTGSSGGGNENGNSGSESGDSVSQSGGSGGESGGSVTENGNATGGNTSSTTQSDSNTVSTNTSTSNGTSQDTAQSVTTDTVQSQTDNTDQTLDTAVDGNGIMAASLDDDLDGSGSDTSTDPETGTPAEDPADASGTAAPEPIILTDDEPCQIIETENGTYLMYKGEFYPVVAQSDNSITYTSTLIPDLENLMPEEDTYNVNTMLENTLTQYDDLVLENGTYSFWHIGEALQSSVPIWTVNTETGGYKTAFVTQFKLTDATDPTKTQYVLCCDLGTSTDTGTGYYIENVDSAGYYQGEEAADHIKAIAYNGYWGTSGDGRGSLASVKKLLSDAVTEQQKKADGDPDKYLSAELLAALTADNIAALTDGMALSATQAAIWTFANSGTYKVYDVVVGNHHYVEPYYYYKEVDDALYCYRVYAEALTEDERSVLQGLYEVLVNLGSDYMPQDTTTIISKDNFATDTAIIIKDKTDKKSGGKSVYDTDVTFSLAVTPADKDDLIVTVIDSAGNAIATKRIAGDDTITKYGFISSVDQVYTIEDLEIAEGTKITLNLTGIQNLNEGVYLYTASVYNKAQTFVGVAKGSKKVDLAVSIRFYTENMEVYAEVQSDDDPIPPTPTPTKPDPTIPVISVGVNPGSEPAGEHDPQHVLDPEYKELFEEDVPLDVRYMIPRTGDNMALYLAISMISGMSLAAVTISKKRSK